MLKELTYFLNQLDIHGVIFLDSDRIPLKDAILDTLEILKFGYNCELNKGEDGERYFSIWITSKITRGFENVI